MSAPKANLRAMLYAAAHDERWGTGQLYLDAADALGVLHTELRKAAIYSWPDDRDGPAGAACRLCKQVWRPQWEEPERHAADCAAAP